MGSLSRALSRRGVSGWSQSFTDQEESETQLRETVRRFVDKELLPHVAEWEANREFPQELYKRAGDLGLLQIGFPEPYGIGGEAPHMMMAVQEELCRTAAGGLVAGLSSHFISMPPIIAMGSDEQIERVVLPVLAGEKIGALGA